MNIPPFLADVSNPGAIAVVVAGLVVMIFILLAIWAGRYTKVGPNEVLIVSGRKHRYVDPDGTVQGRGFRVVKGGGTFIIPVLEKMDVLSLELLTIDVQTPEVYTSKGVPVHGGWRGADQGQGRRHFHFHRRRAVPEQGHRRHQEHRHANAGRPPARDSRHDDRRRHLSKPRCLRLEGAGSRRRRHGEHGPGHRQLHDP